jgi:dihydrodipicolinate synthase/N-acetylneuraminate lyase
MKEVIDFFKTLGSRFPDCRFIHYNNGPHLKKLCKIDLYKELAKEVPNLVAVKYSTPNMYEIHGIVTAD